MNSNRIYLSLAHLGGQESKYINDAFENNWITSGGPNVEQFENDIKNYLETDCFPVALNSGTSALHLGLILLGVSSGDEVICQSLTFVASANPIVYQGATPIFVDSENETWNMCPVSLEQAIVDRISKGKKPKAIITIHLYGMPCRIDEISAVAKKYNIPILEDSAEALGSQYKNRKCGTFGNLSVISFNGNKIITTSGGGILVTSNKNEKDKAVYLSTQARDNAPHYQHSEIGYNYRMSNICAGIGRGQMQVLDKHIALRRKVNQFYNDFFSSILNIKMLQEPTADYFSNHWLSAVLLESFEQREALRDAFEKANIETRPLWKPMHMQPVFAASPFYGTFIAEELFEKGLCLPSGSNLSDAEMLRIEMVLKSFFKQ